MTLRPGCGVSWNPGRIAVSLLILSCVPANAQAITVRVCNQSSAGPLDVTGMRQTVGAVFRHSGIEIRWLECSPRVADGRVILLTVVNASTRGGSHTLGWTTFHTSEVTVLFRHASGTAKSGGLHVSPGQILGYSAAHEMGHALLGSGEHALFGVMKAQYTRRDLVKMSQGTLFFTAEQARLLEREVLAARGRDVGISGGISQASPSRQ